MEEKTRIFIEKKFYEYYDLKFQEILLPSRFEDREFGFIIFKDNIIVRHKRFKDQNDLKAFLKVNVPSNIYYSSAYYERPNEPMEDKGWKGADLIFDIDADHIITECNQKHDIWICEKCQKTTTGDIPKICDKCGGKTFKREGWLCDLCLDSAKYETLKLLDFLKKDFGFSDNILNLYFSGHRGYHIHINIEEITKLEQSARKEIVDYITGTGLNLELHGSIGEIIKGSKKNIVISLQHQGWEGRIIKGIHNLINQKTMRIGDKKINKIINQRRGELQRVLSKDTPFSVIKGMGLKTWKKIISYAVESQTVAIDTVVTTDIHRLIRLPGSLHGKTGLKVVQVPLNMLPEFDPLEESMIFEGELKIFVKIANKFRLGKEFFGPYKEEIVEIPMAAAIYLLCKNVAVIL